MVSVLHSILFYRQEEHTLGGRGRCRGKRLHHCMHAISHFRVLAHYMGCGYSGPLYVTDTCRLYNRSFAETNPQNMTYIQRLRHDHVCISEYYARDMCMQDIYVGLHVHTSVVLVGVHNNYACMTTSFVNPLHMRRGIDYRR